MDWLRRKSAPITPAIPAPGDSPAHNASRTVRLVHEVAPMIDRMRTAYGFDPEHFARFVERPIGQLAAYVADVPASNVGRYQGACGALRMCLEIAFCSLQAAEGRTFAASQAGEWSARETHKWRLAALLTGMFCELHRVIAHAEVVAASGERLQIGATHFDTWLAQCRDGSAYHVRWRTDSTDARAAGLWVASRCLDDELLAHLNCGQGIHERMQRVIAGGIERSTLCEIVRRTASAVLDRQSLPYGVQSNARTISDDLVQAVLDLLSDRDWQPSEECSNAWCGEEGVFLRWPQAGERLLKILNRIAPDAGIGDTKQLLDALSLNLIVSRTRGSTIQRILPPNEETPAECIVLSAAMALRGLGIPLRQSPVTLVEEAKPAKPVAKVPTLPLQDDLFAADSSPTEAIEPQTDEKTARPELHIDTRGIVNPIVAEAIAQVMAEVARSYDEKSEEVLEAGLFVPLRRFEKRIEDTALVVRALAQAQFLHVNESEPHKKIVSRERDGGVVRGVVIRAACLRGWDAWKRSAEEGVLSH